ncbi:MAG: HAMP domain-containing sensor histidine kinase [Acutalibacteraceae bacterium]|nr:HAMP domain-containing sensor histidine kinase [Acutalibacteraceae bacterium]
MFKRLSVKLAVYIVLILVLIIGGVSALYAVNSKDLYISNQKSLMSSVVKELNNIDFDKEIENINEFLDKYYEQTYELYICDEDITPVFSTKRMVDTAEIIKRLFIDEIDEYKENNSPVFFEKSDDRYERIVLKTKVNNHGKIYYIFIEESLRTSDAVVDFTNSFLVKLIVIFIIVSGIVVFILINRTTRSLRTLSDVAAKISEGDYSVRYNGKITNDEVGVLASNLNFMANTIAENVNDLKNYNFLLKEDNSRMSEYESMRKRVLTNVTHELKTPLAIISSQIEMMTVTKSDEKKKYYYESAMDEIDKMSKLISRLLNFSAGEKVIFENEKTEINLGEYIKNLCDKSITVIKSKNVKFKEMLEDCKIIASLEHIEHIFNNYLMNAIQYGAEGGLIEVCVKKQKDYCRLSVFNEGSSIDESESEKIWTDFYRVQTGIAQDSKKVGIGLFIVKEISLINHDRCGFINRQGGVEFWYDFCENDY